MSLRQMASVILAGQNFPLLAVSSLAVPAREEKALAATRGASARSDCPGASPDCCCCHVRRGARKGMVVGVTRRPPSCVQLLLPAPRECGLHSAAHGRGQSAREDPSQNSQILKKKKKNESWVGGRGLSPADTQSCCRKGTDILLLASSSPLCRRAVETSLNPSSARSPVQQLLPAPCPPTTG